MANVSIHGNIGREPELKQAGTSQVLSFSVADKGYIYSKSGDPAAQWYNVEVWGKDAERLSGVLAKGSGVVVYGQLIQRPYEGRNGKGLSLDVKANTIEFAGKKPESSASSAADDFDVPF